MFVDALQTSKVLKMRSVIIQCFREHFFDRGYFEVSAVCVCVCVYVCVCVCVCTYIFICSGGSSNHLTFGKFELF